jgi:hypothetical protein
MRKALIATAGVIGLLAVFVGSAYVSMKLRAKCGIVGSEVMALGFLAAWMATGESKRMAAKVLAALRAINMSLKEAALLAGMNEAQLSAQLNGREIMQLSRYAHWGPEWEHAFAMQLLPPTGLWIQNEELAEILRPLTQQQERKEGAA